MALSVRMSNPALGQKRMLASTQRLSGQRLRAVQPRVPSLRRQTVITTAGIGERVFRIGRSYARYYGDKQVARFEDPNKVLDQIVVDIEADLTKIRKAAAQVGGTRRMLEGQYEQAKRQADEWYRKAQLAVRHGDDELARLALLRRKPFEEKAAQIKPQLDIQTKALDSLLSNARFFESKLQECRLKKESLKARANAAAAQKQINEWLQYTLGDMNARANKTIDALERMEQKVLAVEAEAEAGSHILGDPIEHKFRQLESNVDWEMKEMQDRIRREQGRVEHDVAQRAQRVKSIFFE